MSNLLANDSFFYEELIGKLTYTAYLIALKAGIQKPFLEVELELWNSFHRIFEESRSKTEETDRLHSRKEFSQSAPLFT